MLSNEVVKEWQRYGEAIIGSMAGVLGDALEQHHPVLLETADYWLSLGLTIGFGACGQGATASEPDRG